MWTLSDSQGSYITCYSTLRHREGKQALSYNKFEIIILGVKVVPN